MPALEEDFLKGMETGDLFWQNTFFNTHTGAPLVGEEMGILPHTSELNNLYFRHTATIGTQ